MYLLPIFDSLHSKNLVQLVTLAINKRVSFGFDLEKMEFSLLVFAEVVHQFCDERELLERGCEDGVFTEVNLVFIKLQALWRVNQDEAFLKVLLFALFFH